MKKSLLVACFLGSLFSLVLLSACTIGTGFGATDANGGEGCGSSIDFQSGQTYQLSGTPVQLSGKTELKTPYGDFTLVDGCKTTFGGVDVVHVKIWCNGHQITNSIGIPTAYVRIPVNVLTKACEPYPPASPYCYMTVWIGWSWQGFIPSDQLPHEWYEPPHFPKGT